MLRYNPFINNFQYVTFANFSFKRIRINETICIPEDQQMIVRQSMVIEGHLRVEGSLVIL